MGSRSDITRYRDLYHGQGSTRREERQAFLKLHEEMFRLQNKAHELKTKLLEDIRLNQEEIDALRNRGGGDHSMWQNNNREYQLNRRRNTLLTRYNNIELTWSQSLRSAHKAVWEACQTLTVTSEFIARVVKTGADDPDLGQHVNQSQRQGGTSSLSYSQSPDPPRAPAMQSVLSHDTTARDTHRRAEMRRRRSERMFSGRNRSRLDTTTLTIMKEDDRPPQPVRQTQSTQSLFSRTEDGRRRASNSEDRMEHFNDGETKLRSTSALTARAMRSRSPPPARVPSHAIARTPQVNDAAQISARIPAWDRQSAPEKKEINSARGQHTGNNRENQTANGSTGVMRRLDNSPHAANHLNSQATKMPTTGGEPSGSSQLIAIEESAGRNMRFPIPSNPYAALRPNVNGAAATQKSIDWNTRHQLLVAPHKATGDASLCGLNDDEYML